MNSSGLLQLQDRTQPTFKLTTSGSRPELEFSAAARWSSPGAAVFEWSCPLYTPKSLNQWRLANRYTQLFSGISFPGLNCEVRTCIDSSSAIAVPRTVP